ncbi:MAG: glycosyltransferase [Minisyncoccia bacterium]
MNVLTITGDKSFGPGNKRYELQRAQVDELVAVYWGRSSLWPKIPQGTFDVVTSQDPFFRGLFAWHAARTRGAKLHIQVHTDLDAQPLLRHVLAQIVLCHADGIRVVSEKLKARVEKVGVRAPVSVLPIFINVSRFRSPVRKSHEGKNMLWVGRFEEEKDPLAAISIFEKVRRETPDAKLIMLGKGSLEARLKDEAKNLAVEFPGWQDPIPFLEKADVVLSTSKHESFGASIVEALAAGVPVVAPDVGIAREAGAFVVSREGLAQKVIEVLQSGVRAELKLHLSNAEEWARAWYIDISIGLEKRGTGKKDIPQIIKDVGFDFDWDNEKVWALDVPTEEMDITELAWHFDVPFLWEDGVYNLTPREVIEHPKAHEKEYDRTMRADFAHPIEIMHNKERWLILDGLHRLMKASMLGDKIVRVRKISRERIPEILP